MLRRSSQNTPTPALPREGGGGNHAALSREGGGWITWLALGGLLLWLGWRVADFAQVASYWLPYPYPRQGSEGLTMYESLLLRGGENIWLPLSPERFISAPYPPLYYLLAGSLLDPQQPDFVAGRVVSLIAALAAAICAGLTVWFALRSSSSVTDNGQDVGAGLVRPIQQSIIYPARGLAARRNLQSTIPALVAGGLFLTLPPVLVWASRYRADMTALALVAAGLAVMQARPRGWGAWVGAMLFALSFYTKQTYLAGPLGGGLFLLLLWWQGRRSSEYRVPSTEYDRGRKVSFGYVVLWSVFLVALLLVPTLIISAATDGGYWAKMVTYHNLPWEGKTFGRLLEALWLNLWPLIVLAAGYVGWWLWSVGLKRGDRGRMWRSGKVTITLPFLLASVITLPSGGVIGADSNHLLAVGLALVLVAGETLARALREYQVRSTEYRVEQPAQPRSTIYNLRSIIPLAVILLYLWASSVPAGWYGLDLRQPEAEQQAQLARVIQNVRANPGTEFLADEVGMLVLAGRRPAYDDLFTMTALADKRLWSERAVLDKLNSERFALVLLANPVAELRRDIMTGGMRDALTQHYYLKFADIWYTYEGNGFKPKLASLDAPHRCCYHGPVFT